MAKLSVSALLFDYVLTGPISAVSAGLYIAALLADILAHFGAGLPVPRDQFAPCWRRASSCTSGGATPAPPRIEQRRPSHRADHHRHDRDPAGLVGLHAPDQGRHPAADSSVDHLRFSDDAVGWLKDTRFPAITAIALLIGFGHSFLAMSGYESLAQVYREIESPKPLNLRRTGLVVFIYSLIFTASVSFLAASLIPESVRPQFYDNLISGIAMNLAGPQLLRLTFQAFVVVVGFLILASAVNTAIVGSNAVLSRVSEMASCPSGSGTAQAVRHDPPVPHLIVGLQLLTVLLSGGHIYILGEAYAFGVIWSFASSRSRCWCCGSRTPARASGACPST